MPIARRCAFIKLYGLVGTLIAIGMLIITGLATLATGIQVWFSQTPAWVLFKTSLAAFLCVLVLNVIILGDEFGFWNIDNEFIDNLSIVWIGVTIAMAAATFWIVK